MTLRHLWLMMDGVRRRIRHEAFNYAACVGAAFGGSKVDWGNYLRTGDLSEPPPFVAPDTPNMRAARERIRKIAEQQGKI